MCSYHRYADTLLHLYYYVMLMYHWYMDTLFHWISDFIYLYHCYMDTLHSYIMFLRHCYMDPPVYMHRLSLYSCCMDHCLYYMNYCYMDISVFSLHDCFPLLILIISLLDMWVVDLQRVKLSATWIQATRTTSRIPHLLFPISCYLVSYYQQS